MQPLSSCALSAFPRQCPAKTGYPGGLQVPDGTAVLLPVPEPELPVLPAVLPPPPCR